MKGFVIYPTYLVENNKSYVCLYGRLENGESFVTINESKPYFYIKKEDLKNALDYGNFEYEETDMKTFDGKTAVKIILNFPADIPKLRNKLEENNITCYEADIRFPYRFMMDNGIQGSLEINGDYDAGERVDRIYKNPEIKSANYIPKNLKVLSFDIESSKGDEDDVLYCIGYICNNKKKVLINSKEKVKNAASCNNEEELIETFIKDIIELDPDIITGWNVIDFDFNYLNKKCKKLKIEFDLGRKKGNIKLKIENNFFRDSKAEIIGRQVLDALGLMKVSFIKVSDYKLDTVASEILNDTKLIRSTGKEKYQEIDNLWRSNKEKLVAYNLKDAELVLKIIEKTKILDLTIHRSILTGMPLDRVNASIASLDSLYIREANKKGIVCPSGNFVVKEEGIKGGYVRESNPGIYDYILVLDFKSLYPSIMRTFNIDPYSYVKDCKGKNLIKAPNGVCFRNEDGILPSILEKLYHAREEASKKKDELTKHAIKILSNSFFGVLGNPSCRFFDMGLVNAITYFGQHLIKMTSKEIEKLGYKVIYSDSISKERFVTLLINNILTIKNIELLFNTYKDNLILRGEKEIINLVSYNIKALTLNAKTLKPKFSKINEIIRHKTNKKVYRINQKYGETICTEDHSLVVFNKNKLQEVKPIELGDKPLIQVKYKEKLKELKVIDLYEIIKNYSLRFKYKGREKISEAQLYDNDYISLGWMKRKNPVLLKRYIKVDSDEFMSLCRLLGFYIAEGASSTPETTMSRLGASISNSNVKILQKLQRDYYNLFKNVKTCIILSTKKKRQLIYFNNGIKKETSYHDQTMKLQLMNGLSAVFFRMLCGQKSKNKKLPEFIYHVHKKYKLELLKYMKLGDGGTRKNDKRYSEEYTKNNFSYTSNSLQLISGLTFLLNQLGINYSIQYRPDKKVYNIQTSKKNNVRIKTTVTHEEYEGYVYDLNIEENHMFVDSCGQILLHNTDSNFIVSKAKNSEEADKIGNKITKKINDFYKDFIKKEYNRKSYLELSYDKCFTKFLMPKLRKGEAGAKKRYAGLIIKDGKESIQFTGLETIRSDWTELAKKYQNELFDRVFHNKEVTEYTKKFIRDLKSGKYDDLLVYRKNIRKDLKDYSKITPPHVKAARKLKNLESTKIEYIMTEDGPEPIQKLKHKIDYEHYIEKQIKPLADSILTFFNTNFDNLIKGKQVSLSDY